MIYTLALPSSQSPVTDKTLTIKKRRKKDEHGSTLIVSRGTKPYTQFSSACGYDDRNLALEKMIYKSFYHVTIFSAVGYV